MKQKLSRAAVSLLLLLSVRGVPAAQAGSQNGAGSSASAADQQAQPTGSLLVMLPEKLYRVYSDGTVKTVVFPEIRHNKAIDVEIFPSPDQRSAVFVLKDQCSEDEDSIHVLRIEDDRAAIRSTFHRLRSVVPYQVRIPAAEEIHDEFVSWSADSREIIFRMTPVECAEGGGAPGTRLRSDRYVFYAPDTGKIRFLDLKSDLQFIAAVPGNDLLLARLKKDPGGDNYFSEIMRIDSATGRPRNTIKLGGKFDAATPSRNQRWIVLVPFQPEVGASSVVLDTENDSLRIVKTPGGTYISDSEYMAISPSGKNVAYKVSDPRKHRSYLAVNDHVHQQAKGYFRMQWIDDDRLLVLHQGKPDPFKVIDVRVSTEGSSEERKENH